MNNDTEKRVRRKRWWVPTGIVIFALAASLVFFLTLPCTRPFDRDKDGTPRGSGEELFHYSDGSIKAKSIWACGEPQQTIWYKPDGTVFRTTDFQNGAGMWYMLRDDGSLLWECMSVDDHMHGTMTHYDEQGVVERTTFMVDGSVAPE